MGPRRARQKGGARALCIWIAGFVLACGCGKSNPSSDDNNDDSDKSDKQIGSEQPEPDAPPQLLLRVAVKPDSEDPRYFTIDATPEAQAEPLTGLVINRCDEAIMRALPCGWGRPCNGLALLWLKHLGLTKQAKHLVEQIDYPEVECDPDEPPLSPSSGDFVAHAAVIEHSIDVLASDRVAELLVPKDEGWKIVARIEEQAIEGMSVQSVHEPAAGWQLEIDQHPGKELVLLVTGYDMVGDEVKSSARLIVCRAMPQPDCRRLEIGAQGQVELFNDGTLVLDEGMPKEIETLPRAVQRLIGDA